MDSEIVQARREPLPQDRGALLTRAGPGRTRIYELVRQVLDELEEAAPWEDLYYPPDDAAALMAMEASLLQIIDGVPPKVGALKESLEAADAEGSGRPDSTEQLFEQARFFFDVIHASVEPEIANLRSKLESASRIAASRTAASRIAASRTVRNGPSRAISLTSEDRDSLCGLTADLKGKYSSSIMGVATSLVLKDLGSGLAAESILFAERAEEIERNRLLVETLSEVIENITSLLREVPLAKLVDQWRREQRVDLYALTPLYQLLGNLGKLMKEKSRRAIYSGDYHQIRKRERLLDARINELAALHNRVWETDAKPAPVDSSYFSLMIQKATELAAILDINILKTIVGDNAVEKLVALVANEKESTEAAAGPATSAFSESVPRHLHPLIPLLHTEDLQTFLGLLLGSVLKRASLTREREAKETVAQAAEIVTVGESSGGLDLSPGEELLAPLGPEIESYIASATVPSAEAPETVPPAAGKIECLRKLQEVLETLLSSSNVHRMAYGLVYRLLKQGKAIPREMLHSMLPYVQDVRNLLIPLLQAPDPPADVAASYAANLLECCTFLCDGELTPDQLRHRAPGIMEKVLRLLDELEVAVRRPPTLD